MPYTDLTMATFMSTELNAAGVALGLTNVSAAIVEAVAEVEAILGSAVEDVTDDLKLRTVARWQAWRTAKGAAANQFDVKAGTTQVWRSQTWDHIAVMLADAEAAASRYQEVQDVLAAGYGTAYTTTQSLGGSPYAYSACADL